MTKRAGGKTRASDEVRLLQDRLDHLPAWILETDLDGIITYSNLAVRSLLGYSAHDLTGRPILDLVSHHDVELCHTLFEEAVSGNQPVEDEIVHFRAKDSSIRAVELNCVPMLGSEGRPVGLRGVARDASKQIARFEEASKDAANCKTVAEKSSEREYRDLVEQISDWVWQVDGNSIYTYASPACRGLLGYEPGEIVGKTPFDFMPPDEAKRVAAVFGAIAARHEQFELFTNTLVHRDGHLVTVETSGTPVFSDGAFRGYRGIDRDISERTRAEEQLLRTTSEMEAVLHAFPDVYFWLDADSTIVSYHAADPSALYAPPEQFMGRKMSEVVPEEVGRLFREAIDAVEATGTLASIEYPLQIAEERRHFEARILRAPDSQVLAIVRDITERTRSEEDLRGSREMLQTVMNNIPQAVFWKDIRSVYLGCNENFARVTEVGTPEAIVGKTDYDLPWTSSEADSYREWDRRVMASNTPEYHIAETALTSEGTIIVDTNKVPLHDAEGSVVGILGTYEDITERKRYVDALQDSEERYRQLFEHSPDMVMLLSGDSGQFIAMNPTVTRVLGYAPYDVLGRTPWDISPEFQPDGRRSKDKAEEMISKARGPSVRFDWVHETERGDPVDCEVSLVSYRFQGENLIQAIVRDVTERKRADDIRRKFEKDIEMQKRSFYRETILSVTGGTLDICEREDVESYIERSVVAFVVEDASHVSPARREAAKFVEQQGITGSRLDQFMIGVGEAITNAIKHGAHGTVHAGADEKSVWVAISDTGSGIESLILPRAVLLRGFSTKPSLGLGYSIMLEVCDRILLTTSDQGTTVVLMKNKVEQELAASPDFLPDTWSNIPG